MNANRTNGYSVNHSNTSPSGTFESKNTRETRYKRKEKKVFTKTPKSLLLVILVLTAGIASMGVGGKEGIANICIAILAAIVTDLLFIFLQKHNPKFTDGAILTGLIIGLVLSSAVPWYQTAITAIAAILAKHVIRFQRKPIFNPAAFGLLVTLSVFSSGQSWWGGFSLLPPWCMIFILIGGFVITQKVNKFPQVLTFLGTYFLLFLLLGIWDIGDAADALRPPFVNSLLFLAFFMVTDPPTSPAKYKDQIWFGILAASLSVLDYTVFRGLSYLLAGLLAANAWKTWKAWRTKRKTQNRKVASA